MSRHRKSLEGTVLLPSVASTSQCKTSPPLLVPPVSLFCPLGRPCWGGGRGGGGDQRDQRDQPWASPCSSRAPSSSPKQRQSFMTAEDKTGAVGEQRAESSSPSTAGFLWGFSTGGAFVWDSKVFFHSNISRNVPALQLQDLRPYPRACPWRVCVKNTVQEVMEKRLIPLKLSMF